MSTTTLTPTFLLPGDPIGQQKQPPPSNTPIKLSTGLRLLQTSRNATSKNPITPTKPGLLTTDPKRNTCTLTTFPHHRYLPTANDLVIAQIHHSSPDYFHCTITPHTPHAFLAQLAFEGATRKTRPQLKPGEIVYARVLSTGVGAGGGEVELTCVNPATGKAEPGGLGPLVGGMVFELSVGLAERLMMKGGEGEGGGVVVLEELGRRLEGMGGFEVAVGRNGRVWVDCSPAAAAGDVRVKILVVVGRCLREVDENGLGVQEQKKVVGRALREAGLER
ncbi:hypothetical protein FQN50_004262 [Emmonsiellopsis sp. PD_5]|nr:hypothetical protein FQN50_004262 [Emmonsiellopsis sp. PD_5]